MTRNWEPYEIESFGGGTPDDYRRSRLRLIERLKRFQSYLTKAESIRKIIEEARKKNENGLPF